MHSGQESGTPPLDLRVVEAGGGVAVNFAGRCLADGGATVVKLESVPGGDPCRGYPPYAEWADPPSSVFTYVAAGTFSVVWSPSLADLLVGGADIVLHDFVDEPDWLRSAALRHRAPLAMVAVTPYGQGGPKRDLPGSELTLFQAGGEGYLMPSGLAHEESPAAPPLLAGRYVPSYQAGMTAAIGALAALRFSRLVGGPERVDISIQDSQLSLNHLVVSRHEDGVVERRANRAFRYGGVLRCRDGYVQVLTLEDHQWVGMCAMLGTPEWAHDPRFADQVERARRGGEINQALRSWAAARSMAEVMRAAEKHGVPAGPFLAPVDLPADPQLAARGFFRTGSDLPGIPFQLLDPPFGAARRPAPKLGEHTALFVEGFERAQALAST